MDKKNLYRVLSYSPGLGLFLLLIALLAGCSSNPIQSIFATSTPTFTVTPTVTNTPTVTPTPTQTPTPLPTDTPIPTPTLVPGSFSSPLGIGDVVTLVEIPEEYLKAGAENPEELQFTLLDAKRGLEAQQLAQQYLGWLTYAEPIEGQEYLAVSVHLKVLRYGDNNEVKSIYPYWSLTLRYTEEGSDTWSVDPVQKFTEGYPPIEGEGWVFYLIKKDSKPFLYFQPELMIAEQAGVREHGAYFQLFGD